MKSRSSSVSLLVPVELLGLGRLVVPEVGQPNRTHRQRQATKAVRSERPTVPPPLGQRSDEPALVLLVIDYSASEQAADPHGYRHVAARRILALLREDLMHRGDRIAAVQFSTQPQPWLGATNPHTRRGHQALRHVLQPVVGGSGTDVRAALDRGARLIPGEWRGSVVAILLSDGQDGSTTKQLQTSVGQFPSGAVHIISINSSVPATWEPLLLGSVTVVPSVDRPDEVEWAAARVLYQALGLGWAGPDQPPVSS